MTTEEMIALASKKPEPPSLPPVLPAGLVCPNCNGDIAAVSQGTATMSLGGGFKHQLDLISATCLECRYIFYIDYKQPVPP
jgi:hypothetical protein